MADVFLLYFCTLGIIYRVLAYCDHTLRAKEREKKKQEGWCGLVFGKALSATFEVSQFY